MSIKSRRITQGPGGPVVTLRLTYAQAEEMRLALFGAMRELRTQVADGKLAPHWADAVQARLAAFQELRDTLDVAEYGR